MYEKFEKRQQITCDSCGTEMIFAKELMKSFRGDRVYLKYICPRRIGEKGCGKIKWVLFDREANVKYRKDRSDIFVVE